LVRIFDKALLTLIDRLAAEEVGKTWLNTQQLARQNGEEVQQYRFHHVNSSPTSLNSSGSSKRSRRLIKCLRVCSCVGSWKHRRRTQSKSDL
jgi:hypothetical protein